MSISYSLDFTSESETKSLLFYEEISILIRTSDRDTQELLTALRMILYKAA